MTKWEQVFTEVLASLVAGSREDLMDRFCLGNFDSHAHCLTSIASNIADSAIKKMQYNELNTPAKGGNHEQL
jgi:hypothetical protein